MSHELHIIFSRAIWMFYLVLGIWGLYRAVRQEVVGGDYLGAMAVIQLFVVIQSLVGLVLWVGGARPGRVFDHLLYAAFAVVFLPGLFAYQRGDDSNNAQWLFALACLFMFGVALRLNGPVN